MLRNRNILTTAAAAVLVLIVSFAAVGSYPDKPVPFAYVSDFAAMFGFSDSRRIEDALVSLESATGVEFAVVTIASLEGESIDEYAVKVFEKWGIGKKDKDNGLLLLISRDDREMRIEVGYGLEGDIPDSYAGRIIDEIIIPAFREADYAGGVIKAVEAVRARVTGGADVIQTSPAKTAADIAENIAFGILALVMITAVLITYYGIRANRPGSGRRPPSQGTGPGRSTRPPYTGFHPGGFGGGKSGGGFGSGRSGGFGGGRSGGGGAKGKW